MGQAGRSAGTTIGKTECGVDRRRFLAAAALGVFTFQVGGTAVLLTPEEAKAKGASFGLLSVEQISLIEALGEAIAPGARKAGISHFLDQQLVANIEDCLLMARYMDLPPPLREFYFAGLDAFQAACRAKHSRNFEDLDAPEQSEFVGAAISGAVEHWQGPPAPFFMFLFRSDVVDVTYGTIKGFERLGVPYLAHIEPGEPW